MKKELFDEKNDEEAFYVAALADYCLRPYYQKGKALNNYAKYKWHVITIFGYMCCHQEPPKILQKKKVAAYCSTIISICKQENMMQDIVNKIPIILNEIGLKENRDEVRSATYAKDVIRYCHDNLVSMPN